MATTRIALAATFGLLAMASVAGARPGHGRMVATIDGGRIAAVESSATFCDENLYPPNQLTVIGIMTSKNEAWQSIGVNLLYDTLTRKTIGAVPCVGVYYSAAPPDGLSQDWGSTSCSVTLTKRPVIKRFCRKCPPALVRLRGRFDATVAPVSGQGGADLVVRGKFVSTELCGSGE